MARVGDVMSVGMVTAGPAATVSEAATLMSRSRVGSVLVMEPGRLTGIFTERDVVRALGADFDAAHHPISEWMTPDPRTASPDDDTDEALQRMVDGGFRHLPVVDAAGVPVGMLSMRDLSRLAVEERRTGL